MQVRAIIGAALDAVRAGLASRMPEIMIPLVINVREIRLISEIIDQHRAGAAARETRVDTVHASAR